MQDPTLAKSKNYQTNPFCPDWTPQVLHTSEVPTYSNPCGEIPSNEKWKSCPVRPDPSSALRVPRSIESCPVVPGRGQNKKMNTDCRPYEAAPPGEKSSPPKVATNNSHRCLSFVEIIGRHGFPPYFVPTSAQDEIKARWILEGWRDARRNCSLNCFAQTAGGTQGVNQA
jgi:hypothetical protein